MQRTKPTRLEYAEYPLVYGKSAEEKEKIRLQIIQEIETISAIETIPEIETISAIETIPEIETISAIETIPSIETTSVIENISAIPIYKEIGKKKKSNSFQNKSKKDGKQIIINITM